MAWYILGAPASEYRALFAPFLRAHKIAQAFVCTLMRDPHTDMDAFIVELQLTHCMVMNDVLGDSTAGQTNVMYSKRYVSLSQVRRRTTSNSPGAAAKDSDDYGGA